MRLTELVIVAEEDGQDQDPYLGQQLHQLPPRTAPATPLVSSCMRLTELVIVAEEDEQDQDPI